MHNFKELKIWQRAMDIAERIYLITRAFPKEELYGISSQLRRAAISIPSNIAEGAGRGTNPDFKRFLGMANGSINEVETQLILAGRLGLLDAKELGEEICRELDIMQKMIFSFQQKLTD